jgi:hypothetical protein
VEDVDELEAAADDAALGPGPAETLALPRRRWPRRVGILLVALLVGGVLVNRELGTRPMLALDLMRMEDADSTARHQLGDVNESAGLNSEQIALFEAIDVLDRKHTTRLKEIVEDHGWPDRGLVGRRGAKAALVIVRHARHDCAFQRHAVELMRDADVSDADVVELEARLDGEDCVD